MSDVESAKQTAALKWEIKDFAVLLPLLGTSLAIAWEVGRFSPTGGFGLFGLLDHLVAATAALPIALAMGTFFALSFWIVIAMGNKMAEVKMPAVIAALIVLGPFAAAALWTRGFSWKEVDGSDLVVFGAFAFLMLNQIWLRFPLIGPIGMGFFFVVAILMSLTLSSEQVKKEMTRADKGEGVSTITTKSATYKARVLMAGDRGLLTYSPESKQVLFQRGDELVSLEVKP